MKSSTVVHDLQHPEEVESDQASPSSHEVSSEEEGSSVDDSDVSSLPPNRDKGPRHWDERGARPMLLPEQEPAMPAHTALTDSRVNFRLGTGGLQVKMDYRADPALKIPPCSYHHPLLTPAACTMSTVRGRGGQG